MWQADKEEALPNSFLASCCTVRMISVALRKKDDEVGECDFFSGCCLMGHSLKGTIHTSSMTGFSFSSSCCHRGYHVGSTHLTLGFYTPYQDKELTPVLNTVISSLLPKQWRVSRTSIAFACSSVSMSPSNESRDSSLKLQPDCSIHSPTGLP